jgi:regulator of sigma E protease
LKSNDLFVSVNDQTIDSIEKLQKVIAENLGKPVAVIVDRNGQTVHVTLTPRTNPPEGEGPLGVRLTNPVKPVGLGTAAYRGVAVSFEYIRGILVLPVRILQGQVSPQEGRLVGYKGMYDIYQEIASPLWFFMAISVSLGIMNLLPIPALDGGRILLTLPEILFKRRIPPQYENAIHMIGFAALILLLIYINVQDFLNPIRLP